MGVICPNIQGLDVVSTGVHGGDVILNALNGVSNFNQGKPGWIDIYKDELDTELSSRSWFTTA